MFSSFDLLIYFRQLPTLAAPLKIDFAPPQQQYIYIGLNHHHLLQHILPALSQTSFPLSSCKIVAAPSGWALNLIKFDGSRPSCVPKELIFQTHVFSFDCLSLLLSLAWHAAWKGGGTVGTGQLAKEIKLLQKKSPSMKISVFFGMSPFYRWNTFLYLKISGFLVVKSVSPVYFFSGVQEYPDIHNIENICWDGNIIQEPKCLWLYLPQCEHAVYTGAVSYFRYWKWGPDPQKCAN